MNTLWLLRAFVRRDWHITTSYRLPFVFELISRGFDLALFFFLARFVDRAGLSESAVIGGDYFGFVVLGIVLMGFAGTSVSSFAQRLRLEQTTGTLEALFASPSPPSVTVLGSAAYDLIEAAAYAVATVVIAVALFGLRLKVSVASVLVALLGTAATIAVFAAIGVAIAGFVIVYKRGGAIIGFVTSGLALLGGVYYDVDVLPSPLRALSSISPFTWSLRLLRSTLLRADADWLLLGLLVAGAAVMLPVALRLFAAALRRAERAGTLAQY